MQDEAEVRPLGQVGGLLRHVRTQSLSLRLSQETTPDEDFAFLAQDAEYFVPPKVLCPFDRGRAGSDAQCLAICCEIAVLDAVHKRLERLVQAESFQ